MLTATGAMAVLLGTGLSGTSSATSSPVTLAVRDVTPTRVLFIVLDQFRPEYIDAFGMHNVQALMDGGTDFPRAYLGHMASETVVSHNVMTSGQLPKHMGWADEWYRDSDGVLGETGQQYVSGSLSRDQFDALIDHGGYPKLQDYLHRAFPHRVTAVVGEKAYAVNSMGGPAADIEVTFSGRDYDCDGDGDFNWRGPAGDNSKAVPSYIASPECGRFYVDSSSDHSYGTATTSPAWMYPLDGNRFVPGHDAEHLGGDTWVADAAMKIMARENWSGLFVTMGAIDKAGHMWGGLNDRAPFAGTPAMAHLPYLARNADRQVGRLIDKLRQLGQLDQTLVVLTTDHAQLTARNFYGENGPERGNENWYYGADEDESYLDPQPELMPLIDTGNVQASMQDSAIRTWLIDTSLAKKRQAARVVAELPGVIASFYRTGNHYTLERRVDNGFLSPQELRWFQLHAREIVNTEAATYGPDVIGLLHDNSSYGVAGDHGGAQRSVQRIPVVFSGPGVAATRNNTAIRSVDIMPTILRAMGIHRTYPTDGVPVDLR
jgi:predicted AlkP superfamily pyrophosphatase or phosphodiesterase